MRIRRNSSNFAEGTLRSYKTFSVSPLTLPDEGQVWWDKAQTVFIPGTDVVLGHRLNPIRGTVREILCLQFPREIPSIWLWLDPGFAIELWPRESNIQIESRSLDWNMLDRYDWKRD
jgi:hypothetical protein